MRGTLAGALAAVVFCPGASLGVEQDTHLLIVAGLGGEPAYADVFKEWSSAFHAAAEKRLGIPRANMVYLTESPERDPARIDGRATREEIGKALARAAARCRPGDTLAVILFGHGSGSGEDSRFNLPGPDASARDFATWLAPFASQRVLFVNTASASGDFQKVLAAKNRVILTATKSSQERNEAIFGRYFSEAFSGESADADKSGQVSLLEAFDAAKAQVAAEYQRERRLLTEHAILGDGASGAVARSTFHGGRRRDERELKGDSTNPAIATLEREARALEDRIETLSATKAALSPERYEHDLESLLLDLALKNEEIRALRKAANP